MGTKARRGTLRLRITAVATTVVCVVLAIAGALLVVAQQSTLTDNLRDALEQRSDDVIGLLESGRAPAAAVVAGGDDVLIQLALDDGQLLSSAPSSPIVGPLPRGFKQPIWSTDTLDGAESLIVTRSVGTIEGPAVLHVAGLLADVREARRTIVHALMVGIPLVAVILAAMVHYLVGRTLRPVDDIRREADTIDGSRLGRRVPQPDGHDEISRLATTINRMFDRLDDAARRQQRFVADASHELRGPLARMRANLEVDLPRAEAAGIGVGQQAVLADAAELELLVADLLDLARLDDGEALAARRPVDLDDLVIGEVRRLREGEGPRFDVSRVSSAQVVGDPAQLVRVVRNLADNAARHARSVVHVSLHEAAEWAVLAVTDDGPGIPAVDRERVFERFATRDDARTAGRSGTGLGLAITRAIVERHGGTITVDPALLTGTRMIVTLPVASQA